MKLLRVGAKGDEKPAIRDASGRARDLSGVLPDITPQTLQPAMWIEVNGLRHQNGSTRTLVTRS